LPPDVSDNTLLTVPSASGFVINGLVCADATTAVTALRNTKQNFFINYILM